MLAQNEFFSFMLNIDLNRPALLSESKTLQFASEGQTSTLPRALVVVRVQCFDSKQMDADPVPLTALDTTVYDISAWANKKKEL